MNFQDGIVYLSRLFIWAGVESPGRDTFNQAKKYFGLFLVCTESARALMNLSLEGLAIGYGIVTVENYDQAVIRSKTVANKGLGKGKVAASACLNQINLKIKYTNGT